MRLLLLICLLSAPMCAAESRCGQREMQEQLQPSNPAYSDAMAVKGMLTERKIVVQCVLLSKMANFFGDDQEGAALFRTDKGDFEALFVAAPDSFDALDVSEKRNGEWHSYTLRKTPTSPSFVIDGRRTYFVKRGRCLFVTSDEQLAKRLATMHKMSRGESHAFAGI